MGGGEAFFRAMIGSQSFREPMPMDVNLTPIYQFPPSPLGGTGWPEWAGVGYFLSSRSVRL